VRTPPTAHVYVNVDADKLADDDAPGARCEIKGVGPVPVDVARAYLDEAILTILVKKGIDVTTVAHDGTKAMPAAVRRAVLARDQECVVDTCGAAATQVHHVKYRSRGGCHSVENCRGVCDWCHHLIHYDRYQLTPNDDATYQLRAPP
jgi:5-methylcytosine-specific restriction endonuclease McrA